MFLEDREGIWFGCNRIVRSEGRGAARRGRNSIRLVPVGKDNNYAFKECVVVSSKEGVPLNKADLTQGPQQVIVIADENRVDFSNEDWSRFGTKVQFLRIEVPSSEYVYRFRLFASIVLAEIARQVGQKSAARITRPGRQRPVYESSLQVLAESLGEEVFLEDLEVY